ncbi:MAG TPA: hypothetical protein VLH18_04620 [Candidatus Limnocylindrales bacterium]|nr:hypothetical protein [Candidatus Limnocylindrales bacterium]
MSDRGLVNMDKHTKDQIQLAERLQNIEFPQVQTPLYKQRLKSSLLDYARLSRQPARVPIFRALYGMPFAMRRRMVYALPVMAVTLLVAALLFFVQAPPQPFVHLVLEVNPAVRLIIDADNNVIGFEAMDPRALEIFSTIDFRNKKTQQAVAEIVDRFYGQDILTPGRRILLVMSPVAGVVPQENLAAALEGARVAASQRLLELNVEIVVSPFILDADNYEEAERAGLRPSQYTRLLDAGVSANTLGTLFKVGEELEVEKTEFADYFGTIAELVAAMVDAGMREQAAVGMIREMLAMGMGIDELEAAVERLLDIIDGGVSPARAIVEIRRMIESGRGFEENGETDEQDEQDDEDGSEDYIEPGDEEVELENSGERSGVNGGRQRPARRETRERGRPEQELLPQVDDEPERTGEPDELRSNDENGRYDDPGE